MRNLAIILFLIFGIQSGFAECGPFGMQFFPEQKEVGLNSMFIIQGFDMSQSTILSFKNRKVYLESEDGDCLELILQEILEGQMGVTQATFKPYYELRPNTTYFLKYENETEMERRSLNRFSFGKEDYNPVSWTTTNDRSMPLLNANLTITFDKTEVLPYGCGPAVHAVFNLKNTTITETWYKTEVIEITSNKRSVYYLKEWKNQLYIGHGMCSGPFIFAQNNKYKVRFTPMNTEGNSLKTTEWITFDSPWDNLKKPVGF